MVSSTVGIFNNGSKVVLVTKESPPSYNQIKANYYVKKSVYNLWIRVNSLLKFFFMF